MKHMILLSAFVIALAALAGAPAQAQMSGWDIEGDVDGDGTVGPTDVQHVVNSALGLDERGPASVAQMRRQYVVASPRASLALKPGVTPDTAAECDTIGAVFNFPRRGGRMLVGLNAHVLFRFDRNTEGVWYEGASGLLGTALRVEYLQFDPDNPVDPTDSELEWTFIGRDGAEGLRTGPGIGTAAIGVPFIFPEVGDYLVRATVLTYAVPENEIPDDVAYCGAAGKRNRVLVHVKVIDGEPTQAQLEWAEEGHVGPVAEEFGLLWRHVLDEAVEPPAEEE